MPNIQIQAKEVELNDSGFMLDYAAWNENVTKEMAQKEGVELTDCHWEVIRFLRDYYGEFEVPPSPRTLIKAVGHQLTLGKKCTRKELEDLFPNGGCKQACRFAGLPTYYCSDC